MNKIKIFSNGKLILLDINKATELGLVEEVIDSENYNTIDGFIQQCLDNNNYETLTYSGKIPVWIKTSELRRRFRAMNMPYAIERYGFVRYLAIGSKL